MTIEQVLIPLGKWVERGACKTATPAEKEDFFPGRGNSVGQCARAKKFCARCPVVDECATYALQFSKHDLIGVWGNMTGEERERVRRERNLAVAS